MDFIEGLPKSDGYNVILVVVNRLSKSTHFVPLKHPFTAASVATAFVQEIIRLHSIPTSIVSDRDKVFLSHFWKENFMYQGTLLKHSTAYHPQTEVVSRSVETYLGCFTSSRPREWVRWLPWAEYWYNTSYHSAIRMTPFKVLYGRDPPHVLRYDHGATTTFEVDRYLQERDRVLVDLRGHLLRALQLMKEQDDGKRRDVELEIGEFVCLKLRPYHQGSLAKRAIEKLAPRYYGPFEVGTYRASGVQATTARHGHYPPRLSSIAAQEIGGTAYHGMDPPQPIQIQGTRKTGGQLEVLVQWSGMTTKEATWEPYDRILQQFPLFHLEDKVTFSRGSDDMNGRWGRFYECWKKKKGTTGQTAK